MSFVRHRDLSGQTFGALVAIRRATNDARGKARWLVACACGKQKVVRGSSLVQGQSRSCGGCRKPKTVCVHGHVYAEHGRNKHGACLGCRRLDSARRRIEAKGVAA